MRNKVFLAELEAVLDEALTARSELA